MSAVAVTFLEIMAALADQIRDQLDGTVIGLQVEPALIYNPTPPCIDVYPADPFTEQIAMGFREREVFFAVRARVTTADNVEGQQLLLDLMDPRSPFSVAAAIYNDRSLGGLVGDLEVQGPTGFTVYADQGVTNAGSLLGCEWRTRIVL